MGFNYQRTKRLILENNLIVAFYNQIVPEIMYVLNKFEGQIYDEELKKTINKEMMDKFNCELDIYRNTYHLIFKEEGEDVNIHINCNDEFCLSSDNKIQIVDNMELSSIYHYIDDIDNYIETLKDAWDEIYKVKQEFESKLEIYNELIVPGMESVFSGSIIRKEFYE